MEPDKIDQVLSTLGFVVLARLNYEDSWGKVSFHGRTFKRTVKRGDEAHCVFIKTASKNSVTREYQRVDLLYANEVFFYKAILPRLQEHSPVVTPRLLAARLTPEEETLVLSDLTEAGFRMVEDSLTRSHCRLVLVELGRLHAASLRLLQDDPAFFRGAVGRLKETLFPLDCDIGQYEAVFSGTGLYLKGVLADQKTGRLQSLADDFFFTMQQLRNAQDGMRVLCHGDLWISNVMFRHNEKGDPLEVAFVDFQSVRCGTPALDVSIFLCTSLPSHELHHLGSLVREYVDVLVRESQLLGLSLERGAVETELKEKFVYGLGHAAILLPLSMRKGEDVVGVDFFHEGLAKGEIRMPKPSNAEEIDGRIRAVAIALANNSLL